VNLLTCEHLCLGYGGQEIVHDLSFSVSPGDYLCVVGENGAGKSTLMRTILGLQPPMSGELRLGEDLSPGQIGYLPQQTAVQRDFPASVREVVLSGCLARCGKRPFFRKEDKALARDAMDRLGITDLAGRCYRELSGGGSSSGSCWPGPSAPPGPSCSWTNPSPAWTRWCPLSSTASLKNSTDRTA
jgi:zinc transport system ATP-binding protein